MKKKPAARKPSVSAKSTKHPSAARMPVGAAPRGLNGRSGEESEEPDLEKIISEVSKTDDKKIWNHWTAVQCPYCGENFDVHFDTVEDGHSVNEDCAVCCKPIVLSVSVEEEDIHVSAYRA